MAYCSLRRSSMQCTFSKVNEKALAWTEAERRRISPLKYPHHRAHQQFKLKQMRRSPNDTPSCLHPDTALSRVMKSATPSVASSSASQSSSSIFHDPSSSATMSAIMIVRRTSCPGKLQLVFTPEGGSKPVAEDVIRMFNAGSWFFESNALTE